MITSLRIENFKAWKDTGDFRLAPITGFFGTNSSGKTSILQFLLMLKQTVESPDRQEALNFGNHQEPLVSLGSFRDIVFRTADDQAVRHSANSQLLERQLPDIIWNLSWKLGGTQVLDENTEIESLHFGASVGELRQRNSLEVGVKKFEYQYCNLESNNRAKVGMQYVGGSGYQLIVNDQPVIADELNNAKLRQPVKCYGFPPQVAADNQHISYLGTLEYYFTMLFHDMYYLGPLRDAPQREYRRTGTTVSDVGKRGERTVDALLASEGVSSQHRTSRTLEGRVAYWLRRLGLIKDFRVKRLSRSSGLYGVEVRKTADSPYVFLPDVGFGISQVLPVIALCYYAPVGSIIILEQPELHLHPAVQSELADMLIEAAKERHLQIILESHSEHLLARLQRRVAEEAIAKDDVQLYFCRREEGSARLEPLQMNNFGFITNWPKDFFGDELEERSAMMLAALARREKGEVE